MMPSLDARVLGLTRIYLGLLLLYDLLRRAPYASLLYSNDGVWPNHYALYDPPTPRLVSVLFACSTPAEVGVMMGLMGVVYALFTVGLFTRTMQALAVVSLVSLNSRALFLEDGGVVTTLLLLTYTLLLPMGAYHSVDAWRAREAHARRPGAGEWVEPAREVRSVWCLLVVGQLAVIYFFNAATKTGATWRHGEAVHWVLWQGRVATPLAAWLRMHEPGWFSPLATWGTLVVEMVLPVLLLLPVRSKELRALGLVLALGLHLGIAAMMTLGPFSYAMIGFWLAVQRGEWLDDLARRWGRSTWNITGKAEDKGEEEEEKGDRHSNPAPAAPLHRRAEGESGGTRGWRTAPREAAGWVMLVAIALQITVDNGPVPGWMRVAPPGVLGALVEYPRLLQGWRMFAPEAPREDGILVVDGVTQDGRHVDPFTGMAPRMQGLTDGLATQGVPLCDYLFDVHLPGREGARRQLQLYLDRWHTLDGRSAGDRLVSYEVWWLENASPAPGSTTPGAVVKTLVVKR